MGHQKTNLAAIAIMQFNAIVHTFVHAKLMLLTTDLGAMDTLGRNCRCEKFQVVDLTLVVVIDRLENLIGILLETQSSSVISFMRLLSVFLPLTPHTVNTVY